MKHATASDHSVSYSAASSAVNAAHWSSYVMGCSEMSGTPRMASVFVRRTSTSRSTALRRANATARACGLRAEASGAPTSVFQARQEAASPDFVSGASRRSASEGTFSQRSSE